MSSDMKRTLEQLVIEKHQAVAMAREWQTIAAALALAHGDKNPDGKIVARASKSLLNQLDHAIDTKPVKGGGVILILTPNGKDNKDAG